MRPLRGVLPILLLASVTGYSQAPPRPTGNGRISGFIVTSIAEPVTGATVLIEFGNGVLASRSWWTTTTDAKGAYRFDGLPDGHFRMKAVREGFRGWRPLLIGGPPIVVDGVAIPELAFAALTATAAVELAPGLNAVDVNLMLHRPASLSGRALRRDGSPAGEAILMLWSTDDSGMITGGRSVRTGGDGAFSVDDLGPGPYFLGPMRMPASFADLDRRELTPVTIIEGVSVINTELTLGDPSGVAIDGRVVDSDGRPLRSGYIEYATEDGERGPLVPLNENGSFSIRDRERGSPTLRLMAYGQTDHGFVAGFSTVAITASLIQVEITAGVTGRIRGRVSMDGGRPLLSPDVEIALIPEATVPRDLRSLEGLLDTSSLEALHSLANPGVEMAADGWLEAQDLLGEYRIVVNSPRGWTVTAIRRGSVPISNSRIVVRNAELVDDLEIVIGPR